MSAKAEILTATITVGTTLLFPVFLVELLTGIIIYFVSRLVYTHCGDYVNQRIDRFKMRFFFLKKIKE